jgi:hypothetical protein
MRSLLLPFLAAMTGCAGKVADTWAEPPDPVPTPGVTCGAAICVVPLVCLLTNHGPRSCEQPPSADAGAPGVSPCRDVCAFAACDGPEDCPGSACVISEDGASLRCATLPADACTRVTPTVACHTLADCPSCFAACGGAGTSVAGGTDSLQYGVCLTTASP